MIKPLTTKKEFYVETENEALNYVDDCREGKDGDKIVAQQVQYKSNKNGGYYRVVITYRYNTAVAIQEMGGDADEGIQDTENVQTEED